jgi:flagellar basal body P-ring formation protein FlgA
MNRNTLITLLMLFIASHVTAGEVVIRARSEVQNLTVTLGDIAQLEGFRRPDRVALEAIELGRAPTIGQRRIIPKAFLRSRIQRALPPGSTLRLGRQTEVRRRDKTIAGKVLKQAVTVAVQGRLGDIMTDVARLGVPSQTRVRLPETARIDVRFDERQNHDGALNVAIVIVDGDEEKLVRRTVVEVDRFTEVVTLNREGKRGSVVRANDLTLNRIAQSQVPRNAITRVDDAIGAVLKRTARRGDTLQTNWLDIPPVVLRGQRVRLVARRGSIRLSTMGEALSKGRSQELIRVRNMSSKKIVTGRVTADGNVEMEF